MGCFALAATNTILALHLAQHDGDEHHNHDKCPICQQAFINKNPAILCPVAPIHSVSITAFAITNTDSFSPRIAEFQIPYSHAPPVIS